MIFSVIIFIITLLLLVLIHELGHFLVAKKFGIRVEEFGFGIPPRAWGKKVGETLVSINWLPFGGFVRLYGEDEIDRKVLENPRSFAAQIVWKRILTVLAGVLMNLILAWIIFYVTLAASEFKIQLPLFLDHQFLGVNQQNKVTVLIRGLANDSPADLAGIKVGMEIVAINSQPISEDEQSSLTGKDLIAKIKDLAGGEIQLTLKDQKGNLNTVLVTPRKNPPAGQGALGVELAPFVTASLEYQGVAKILAGPLHSLNIVAYSGRILGALASQSLRTKSFEPVSQTVAGPVGVSNTVNEILSTAKNPLLAYLDFVALLSLNLAVFNALPIPALDGGRLFFLMIEGAIRRKVKAEIERWVHTIGLAILLTLMLLVTFSDLKKLFP